MTGIFPRARQTRIRCPRFHRVLHIAGLAWVFWGGGSLNPLLGVNPESPEVRVLVDRGLRFLEENTDPRLGGKCLVALAFLKDGVSLDHPRVKEALEACEKLDSAGIRNESVYDNALAIIFLAQLDQGTHRELVERYAQVLADRQKPHGGWGYEYYQTGDTSQTQYAILSYWELLQIGIAPKVESMESAAKWLLRTQDPSGGWGYQGQDPGNYNGQVQEAVTLSMLAAGLGSTLISANVLGALEPGSGLESAIEGGPMEKVPAALTLAEKSAIKKIRTLEGGNLDTELVLKSAAAGKKWFDQNLSTLSQATYPLYTLYAIERYKSFEEFLSGSAEEEPEWYRVGYEYIKAQQQPDGALRCPSDPPCATAFSILFLVRSTQKSIKASLGEGTLIGGRGLSANLARMALKGGRLVTERKPTEVDNFLKLLDEPAGEELDEFLSDAASIDLTNVEPGDARRLEQLVTTGPPEARLLAVESLGKLRSLDHVPALLIGLTDPDKRVVRAARDGLKFVSRRFDDFGPPDNFTEQERYDSLESWKNWYYAIRPEANQ